MRGAYTGDNLIPAICSGFQDGSEPAACLTSAPDVCSEGSDAFLECRSGYFAAAGRTRCNRIFGGFECTCAPAACCAVILTVSLTDRENQNFWV